MLHKISMVIVAKHFDTRLGESIKIYDRETKKYTCLEEELNNTLLEYFFPNTTFSFGHGDQYTTVPELKIHPNKHKLLLSSKSRYLYAPPSALEIIDEIFPDRKDRGAYGSIFLGECNTAENAPPPLSEKLNVLIVDDATGDNGDIIEPELAYRLTGDCYGQISDEKYKQLTAHKSGDKYRIIQHRFGWKPQQADNHYRFGKGTLRPMNFDRISFKPGKEDLEIDLIIPLSSIKGSDKQRPGGALKPQIKPGLYHLDIWLGEKSRSQSGKIATSQIWASFPKGVKDVLELCNADVLKLCSYSYDPRQLAQLYCETYENRKQFNNSEEKEPTVMYKLIKADLSSGHGQLLETPKVKRELEKFISKEYKNIATFKNIVFDRAMIVPSKDLANGQICISGKIKDGEEILNFRSPFLNSNGMCVSTHKYTEDIIAPDGKQIEGAICVSDETTEHIYKRITEQIKLAINDLHGDKKEEFLYSLNQFIKTDLNDFTSIKCIEFKDISAFKNSARIEYIDAFNEKIDNLLSLTSKNIEYLPRESEQERQGRDYDGDCIGYTLAINFPNLTNEAKERNKPENAYLPTIKEVKASFYLEGTAKQPEFEEIALQMSDCTSVGIINNHLTALEALESEIQIIKESRDKELIDNYLNAIVRKYSEILQGEDIKIKIPAIYQRYMENMIMLHKRIVPNPVLESNKYIENIQLNESNTVNSETLSTNTTSNYSLSPVENQIFELNQSFYRKLNEEASYQNQIAVDLFKSNRLPNIQIIKRNNYYLYRNVNYVRDKDKPGVYESNIIEVNGCSPTEINISRVNKYFTKYRLESRSMEQFKNLFSEVEFSYQQKAEVTLAKSVFDRYLNEAAELQQRQKIDEGQSVLVRSANELKFEITNIIKTGNFYKLKQAHEKNEAFQIKIQNNTNNHSPHKYKIYAQFIKPHNRYAEYQHIGTIERSYEKLFESINPLPKDIEVKIDEFRAGISDTQVKCIFDKALESSARFRHSLPSSELEEYASATWAISTSRNDSKLEFNYNKTSNFVFYAFTDEIVKRLETQNFQEFILTNLREAEIQPDLINFDIPQYIRFGAAITGQNGISKNVIQLRTETDQYKEIGDICQTDGRLQLGTTATAIIKKCHFSTAKLTIENITVKISELNKFNTEINDDSELEILIKKADIYHDGKTEIFVGNKCIGELRNESHQEAIKNQWLQDKILVNLTVDSVSNEGKHPYAIATNPEDKKLYINIADEFKSHFFNSEILEAQPVIKSMNRKAIVYANNQPIATISQCQLKRLEQTGVFYTPKKALVTGTLNTLSVQIHPQTIRYPDMWVKLKENVVNTENQSPISNYFNTKVDNIYLYLTQRNSIIFESKIDTCLNIFNLAIDERNIESAEIIFNTNEVNFSKVDKNDRELETAKGMRVFEIDKNSITPEVIKTLVGETVCIEFDSKDYDRKLQKLPNRPNLEEYIEPFITLNTDIIRHRKDAKAIIRIGSAYKPHTKESGASAILVSSKEKLELHQFEFYYPLEKADLKAAYQALIYGLDVAKQQEYKFVKIETSNNNLYQRLKGNPNYMHFAGKNSECEALHKQVLELSESFAWGVESKFVSSRHFSTAHNADKIAYDAICQKSHSPNITQRLHEIEKPRYSKPLVPFTNLVSDKEGGREGERERGRVNWLKSKNLIQLPIPYRQWDFRPFCLDDKNSFKIGNSQSCYGTTHEDSITSNNINSINEHSISKELKAEISESEISADKKDKVINQAQESDKEPAKLPSNLNPEVSFYSKHSQSSNSKNSSSLRILGITSIGQFGADLGALEAAKNKGIGTGGIAANGFLTERGSRTDLYEYYGLVQGEPGKGFGQTYKNAYAANIRHSDATVLIGRILNRTDSTEKDLLSIINRYNRPYLIIPKEDILINPENAASQIAQFAVRHSVKSLNIIGERESHAPGIQAATQKAIEKALELNTQAQKDINKERECEGVRERDEISDSEKSEHKNFNTSEIINCETKTLNRDTSKDYDDSPENLNTEMKNQVKHDNKEKESEGERERGRANNQGKHDKEINIGQIEQAEHKISVMVNILKKKLVQYPHLIEKINQSGGTQFLEDKIRISSCKDEFWNGFGLESPFINALSIAYSEIISKTQHQITTHDAKSVNDSFKCYKPDPSSELKNDYPLMSCKETIELLQEWTVNAKFLNRSYLNTIYKIQNDYLENSNPLTNIQLQTMINDSNKANQVSSAINFVNHFMDTSYTNLREDNSKVVEGNNYIIEAKKNKGFIRIIDKNSFDILLYVENHKIQTENLNNDLFSSLESAFKASERNEVQLIHEVRMNKEEERNSNDLGN